MLPLQVYCAGVRGRAMWEVEEEEMNAGTESSRARPKEWSHARESERETEGVSGWSSSP